MSKASATIDAFADAAHQLKVAHAEYLRAEIAHRVERRRAESRARADNPKIPSAGLDLIVEADPKYSAAQERWVVAQYERTWAIGVAETHKLRAWLAVRSAGQ